MENRQSLVSAAMLEAIWSSRKKDLIDLITPFVLYAVAKQTSPGNSINTKAAQKYVQDNFSYPDLPESIIRSVLSRNPLDAFEKKDPNHFAYPVFAVLVYLCLGFFKLLWHPGWVVFLTIPLYYSLVSYLKYIIPEEKLWEVGVPVGVIAAIVPSTNPTSTICYKALIALKAGNTIVFSPHPNALKCSLQAAKILEHAAICAGAPAGCSAV